MAAVGGRLEAHADCFPHVATCFGGGLGRQGETCGALIGALLIIGVHIARRAADDVRAKERAYQLAFEVVGAFRREFGHVSCRKLSGVDLSKPAGRDAYRAKDLRRKRCEAFVAEGARLAFDAIR